MQVTVQLPEEIAKQLGPEAEMPQRIIEAVVLEKYLAEELALGRVAELLGVSSWEAEEFLEKHNASRPYTLEMLNEDRRAMAKIIDKK